jgi:hypothetical protein
MVRRTARILAQGLAVVVVLFLAMLGTDFRTTPIDRPHDWIASHDVVYQTITDYCPHGVWQCAGHNPKASARYRALFGTGS